MDSLNKLNLESNHQLEVVKDNQNKSIIPKLNQSDPKDTNFEYEDNEWDIGIGDLIIDLDADIEKSSNTEPSIIPLHNPVDQNSSFKAAGSNKNCKLKDNLEIIGAKKAAKAKTDTVKMSSSSGANNNKNSSKLSIDHQATQGLKMKIKRTKTGTKTSESKHEIVKSEQNGNISNDQNCKKANNSSMPNNTLNSSSSGSKRGSNNYKKDKEKAKEKPFIKEKQDLNYQERFCNCNLEQSSALCSYCTKVRDSSNRMNNQLVLSSDKQGFSGINTTSTLKGTGIFKKEPQKVSDFQVQSQNSENSCASENFDNLDMNEECKRVHSPPIKRMKSEAKSMVDVCVGTSIGTITEPDYLGPCEPGTSVTLEGIVWHETEGGVLAVNITWRGKTYVGTLIDCTKHDWAPPRFCDSPIEDLDSRLQKGGRAKRGRNNAASNDLLNFTETRSSVHSKLRNGGSKVSKSDKRRKSKDESPSSGAATQCTAPLLQNNSNSNSNLVLANSQNSALNAKKPKTTASPCAVSPVLLECPEQDCSKKYKHANGLKYHQSHAHGTILNAEDDSNLVPDSPQDSIEPVVEKSAESTEPGFKGKLNAEAPKPAVLNQDMNETFESASKSPENLSNTSETKQEPEGMPKSSSIVSPVKSEIFLKRMATDFEQISNDSINEVNTSNSSFFPNQEKANNTNKNKKNRKSPALDDSFQANRTENVRSPAYSDISDDSNAPIEGDQNVKSGNPEAVNSSSNAPSTLGSSGKIMQYPHFPYNFVQPNYPYNIDSSFNSFNPEESKVTSCPVPTKEEKSKESVGNVEDMKLISSKNIKTEKPEVIRDIKVEPSLDQPAPHPNLYTNFYQRHPLGLSTREEDIQRYFIYPDQKRNSGAGSLPTPTNIKEENSAQSPTGSQPSNLSTMSQSQKSLKSSPLSSKICTNRDTKPEEKEKDLKVVQEGQKPTMETQGPPPPPTSQYYLPYMPPGSTGPPFFADPSHPIYRNMLVPPQSPYNSPYHLQVARFSSPEDLSRNTNTKALDLLQQHASQYYNTHKIHELNERVNQLKSPNSNVKMQLMPTSSVLQGNNIAGSSSSALPPNNSPLQGNHSIQSLSNSNSSVIAGSKTNEKSERSETKDAPNSNILSRTNSPPPQRHVHTHHHTHVGVYPMYPGPYVNPAVLASQQAVAVINPFANPPPK